MRQIVLAAGVCAALISFVVPADAQRLYKGVPTSCPEGTRPVPETDNCVPLRGGNRGGGGGYQGGGYQGGGYQGGGYQGGGWQGGGYRRASTVCYFNSGPRAGSSFDFALLGFKPIPVGQSCGDGLGSRGIAR